MSSIQQATAPQPSRHRGRRVAAVVTAIAATAGLAVAASGCSVDEVRNSAQTVRGRGDVVTRDFDLGEFAAVDIGGGWDVTFRSADAASVVITMYENLFDYVEVSLRGDTLVVEPAANFLTPGSTPTIELAAPALNAARFGGAARVRDWDTITGESFELAVDGSTRVTLTLDVDAVSVATRGSSTVTLLGSARQSDIDIAGAGDVRAFGLGTLDTTVAIAGVGNAHITATNTLDVTITGAATVRYDGSPAVTRSIGGAASVRPR